VPADAEFIRIPRSREVGQSYVTAVFTTLRAQLASAALVFSHAPDVILCNGPGTCLPLAVAGLALRFFGVHDTAVVFVESVCRVSSLSLTGKLLYRVADQVQVQWPELKQRCVAPWRSIVAHTAQATSVVGWLMAPAAEMWLLKLTAAAACMPHPSPPCRYPRTTYVGMLM
jgi:beta-1,4-N-acetylglucosaminyltransferase